MLNASLGLIELKILVLNYCTGAYKYRVWITQFSINLEKEMLYLILYLEYF
jgi:hypothetical protein